MEYSDFTKLYSKSITLRFELKPIGATKDNILKKKLLEEDEHRAESYKSVKKLIDEYHKRYISTKLSNLTLEVKSSGKDDSLTDFYDIYSIRQKSKDDKKLLTEIQAKLRKKISEKLTKGEDYKRLTGKELIDKDLVANSPNLSNDEISLISEFKGFTTYFVNFHTNRKNMYTDKEQSTAIAYRLINDNLPKFIDNLKVFEIINNTEGSSNFKKFYTEMAKYLNIKSIEDMFKLDYYNTLLTQEQIEVYNSIIGGKSIDDNTRVQGLNEYVNLYNQQHKGQRLPKFKFLFKQILSDREQVSWLPDEFSSDNELLSAIKECYDSLSENVIGDKDLKRLLQEISSYDIDRIYLSNSELAGVSKDMFGNWDTIRHAVIENLKLQNPRKGKEDESKYNERISKLFANTTCFAISNLNDCISQFCPNEKYKIETYFSQLGAIDNDQEQRINYFTLIQSRYDEVKSLLDTPYHKESKLYGQEDSIEKIKNSLDSIKALQHFVKPLLGGETESDKDENFYGEFISLWNELDRITSLYNKARNYLTHKPYKTDKIKLNFKNSHLLNGWDVNKEKDHAAILLIKDGLYYLAIMDKQSKKAFSSQLPNDGECYSKIDYKLLPVPEKMLPKVFFAKSRIGYFNPSLEIQEIYDQGTHKDGKDFNLTDCHNMIDYFKQSIDKHEDWRNFGFKFSETESYDNLTDFYHEVEHQGYKISFRDVSTSYIDSLVNEGKLYLFQIYNKDFSSFSTGRKNLHTLYWLMLFNEVNLNNVVYKLNGKAEMFFREASLENKQPTHPAHQPIKNKNRDNQKKESTFDYDLIKDKRYTVDKFLFHVPITMNFKSIGREDINTIVNEYLKGESDTHVIGIDRGERHLLYISLINSHGQIVKQFSLNDIINEHNGVKYKTDYHNILDKREKERTEARQSWKSIENIKDLKEGYLSQVVHKIAQLMVEYKAIVVLEDLNDKFIRSRLKFEKQVYQKFEHMLIDKLNYLVDKSQEPTKPGGLLNAYQLTSAFKSFQELGKQSGFLFYIPAQNTSKIDPVTGFVNMLDTRYETIAKARIFFGKFDRISYNKSKGWYEFSFDYDNFGKSAEGTRTRWTICTYGERIKHERAKNSSNFINKTVILTNEFNEFFNRYNIDINANIKDQIVERSDKTFFEGLLALLRLTLQMRNSDSGTQVDYIISPVMDDNGNFYDSRLGNPTLPDNADANGAYNIARKGLLILRQIKQATDIKKVNLKIPNKDWLKFAQEKPYTQKD